MPVVINEFEILETQPTAHPPVSDSPARSEPVHEQVRRYFRDLDVRQRRLTAD